METMEGARQLQTGDYSVFEIVNSRLREIYVGVIPSAALDAVPLRLPPSRAISHWGLYGPDPVRGVALNLPQADARAFMASYVRTPLPTGWRFLV